MSAPDYKIISPHDPRLSVSVWNEPSPNVTFTVMAVTITRRVIYRNKGFFAREVLDLIELCIMAYQRMCPDLPLSPHLLNYLAECEQSRKNKPAP